MSYSCDFKITPQYENEVYTYSEVTLKVYDDDTLIKDITFPQQFNGVDQCVFDEVGTVSDEDSDSLSNWEWVVQYQGTTATTTNDTTPTDLIKLGIGVYDSHNSDSNSAYVSQLYLYQSSVGLKQLATNVKGTSFTEYSSASPAPFSCNDTGLELTDYTGSVTLTGGSLNCPTSGTSDVSVLNAQPFITADVVATPYAGYVNVSGTYEFLYQRLLDCAYWSAESGDLSSNQRESYKSAVEDGIAILMTTQFSAMHQYPLGYNDYGVSLPDGAFYLSKVNNIDTATPVDFFSIAQCTAALIINLEPATRYYVFAGLSFGGVIFPKYSSTATPSYFTTGGTAIIETSVLANIRLETSPQTQYHLVTKSYVDTVQEDIEDLLTDHVSATTSANKNPLHLPDIGSESSVYKIISGIYDEGTTSVQWSTPYSVIGGATSSSYGLVQTGTASGQVPVLDSNGKLVTSVIPAVVSQDRFSAVDESAMLALSSAQFGDYCVRSDTGKIFILMSDADGAYSTLSNWKEIIAQTPYITAVNGYSTQSITLTASDVGAIDSTALITTIPASPTDDTVPSAQAVTEYTADAISTALAAEKYSTVITGDGETNTFTITHNLNQQYVVCQIYDTAGKQSITEITCTSATTLTVAFVNPPASGVTFNVLVRK